jgi:hypothetical protein
VKCENCKSVAIRKMDVADGERFAGHSNFGMLRLASTKLAARENWRRRGMDARGQRFWEVKGVDQKDAVGVAIRFWDALCFERIAGNSE